MENPPTTRINATCACQAFSLSFDLPTSTLPLLRALCLCNGCRTVSGTCGVSHTGRLPIAQIDPSKFNLTLYTSTAGLERYFCTICGAHTLLRFVERGVVNIATGLWDRTEGIIQWTGSKWVEDTLDGGVSVWLNDIVDWDGKERKLQRWMLQDTDALVPPGTLREYSRDKKNEGPDEKLKASCRCGGVKFYITRPNEASKRVQSPFPDLMVPYHTGASSANPENETWWLRSNDTKYLAGTCTCKSCRLASGFEIQTWAFVPKCNIFQENGSPLDYSLGALKSYPSSKDIWREFCGVCGATVFWRSKERPDLVDVSVGLFDPQEGARAESWLDWWTDRVSFEEMAVSKSLVRSLKDGLRSWGEEKAGQGTRSPF
jgi:hypothetical protein